MMAGRDHGVARNDAHQFPFHLIFPTPIPEPPRVISSEPYVSDVSITSEIISSHIPVGDAKWRSNLAQCKTSRAITNHKHHHRNDVVKRNEMYSRVAHQEEQQAATKAPITTTIYANDSALNRLRAKCGIIHSPTPSTMPSNLHRYCSDLPQQEHHNAKCATQPTNNNHKIYAKAVQCKQDPQIANVKESTIRQKVQQVQLEIREQLEKLLPVTRTPPNEKKSDNLRKKIANCDTPDSSSGVESDISLIPNSQASTSYRSCCSCKNSKKIQQQVSEEEVKAKHKTKPNSQTVPNERQRESNANLKMEKQSVATRGRDEQEQMLHYIRKQDQQLQQINDKIEQLLKIHQNSDTYISVEKKQDWQMEVHADCDNNNNIKRSTPSRTQEGQRNGRQKRVSSNKVANISVECSPSLANDYFDSSIEKARREMQKSIEISSEDEREEAPRVTHNANHHNRARERETKRNQNAKIKQQCNSLPAGEEDRMYRNMMCTINSILVRNVSSLEERTSESDPRCDSREGSLVRRSSCSNTPDNSSEDIAGKRHSAASKYHNSCSPCSVRGQRTTIKVQASASSSRLLHSQQSLYIERLASKYELQHEHQRQKADRKVKQSLAHMRGEERQIRKSADHLLRRLELEHDDENDLKVYGLSRHNTSIATKNYLDRYGLTCGSPPRHKDTLHEEEEEEHCEQGIATSLEANRKQVSPRNVSCQANTAQESAGKQAIAPSFSKILDIDAIKNLPKLT